jgi:tungstate transport system permease protein
MSFFSTTVASVLGISLGLQLEKHTFPGKKIVVRVNRTMMGLPPVIVGLLTYMLLMRRGPLGFLGWLFTIQGMVMAQTIIITPIICGMVYTAAARLAPAIRAFAKSMGADRRQTSSLIIREMRSEIYFSIVTGFGRSISEVGAVMLVGGNIKNSTRTMTTAIATLQSAGVFTDGVMLGVILLAMAFVIMVIADRLRKEDVYDENL